MNRSFDFLSLCDEEICEMHQPLRLGEGLSDEDISQSHGVNMTFSFANADIDRTDYSLSQTFTDKDTRRLFKILKRFSNSTLDEMNDIKDKKDDEGELLHLYRKTMSERLKKTFGKMGRKVDARNSLIYHFALYTDRSGDADRSRGVRSPRVYFMVGQYGIMHILFFDPYHELR